MHADCAACVLGSLMQRRRTLQSRFSFLDFRTAAMTAANSQPAWAGMRGGRRIAAELRSLQSAIESGDMPQVAIPTCFESCLSNATCCRCAVRLLRAPAQHKTSWNRLNVLPRQRFNTAAVRLQYQVASVSIVDNNLFKWRLQLNDFDESTSGQPVLPGHDNSCVPSCAL